MKHLISIKNLSVGFQSQKNISTVVNSISFEIPKGKTVALVGESGSGKTVTALSILKLLPYPSAFHDSGKILYNNKNLLEIKQKEIEKIRGNKITAIFQEPMTSLNPLHTVEKQIKEVLITHSKINNKEAYKKTIQLLGQVGLEDIAKRPKCYPHELSGGQRQRVMIAMSIANKPDLLIADEPTTALDVTVQSQIIELLMNIQKQMNMSILFISHDLAVVKKIADYVCIMKEGKIIEQNQKNNIFSNPQENYTKILISSESNKKSELNQKTKTVLKAKELKVWYPINKGILRRTVGHVKAVDSINLILREKQTIGIVGESGSGKTSFALAILKLIKSKGDIIFEDINLNKITIKKMKSIRKKIQIVFQDPFSSLSPRMTVQQIISEGLDIHERNLSYENKLKKVKEILKEVGMDSSLILNRYPHEFSGGQRQRIAIARALILKPKLLIFDEPTSALDVSTQNQIIDLLNNLQNKLSLSYIFISHDIKVIKAVSDYILVMKNGKVVEENESKTLLQNPKNEYTIKLLQSVL